MLFRSNLSTANGATAVDAGAIDLTGTVAMLAAGAELSLDTSTSTPGRRGGAIRLDAVGASSAYPKALTLSTSGPVAANAGEVFLGGDILLGFISAVAFATIVAVVAGLTIAGASAISHDIYANILRHGQASDEEVVRVSRIAALGSPDSVPRNSSNETAGASTWRSMRSSSGPEMRSR